MKIFVDADACPVVRIVEEVAEKYRIDVALLCDTNHILTSDYSEVIVVGAGADAVDYKLISICHKGDIVVSQDYGVAAMALGKGAYAIHQSGKWYTNENIDQMLMERHLNKKARRGSHKNHLKGRTMSGGHQLCADRSGSADPKKRTEEDDKRFAQSFEKMVLVARTQEGD
ncbi:YaiI/YqxD family protein [Coprococcus sp. AF21-14LB]|uniref:YaiI/YqxD family protein n=1 Tax=Coprococcus sp. AF21-14LB TaxID=2292231 RepID=UPI000E48FA80|nr:YaiI/YqxD family protein [Coprococcus sp. AF21-14LB]RGS79944.1 YaiI/YqxD family protein [Coprococcus sp. AF21-14LB]